MQGHQGMHTKINLIPSIILTFDGRYHKFFNPESGGYPEVPYEDVMAKDEAVLEWLENIVSPPVFPNHSFWESC